MGKETQNTIDMIFPTPFGTFYNKDLISGLKKIINSRELKGIDSNITPDLKNNLKESVINSDFDLDSIYCFEDDELWEIVKKNSQPNDYLGVIDSYRIFVPNFYN